MIKQKNYNNRKILFTEFLYLLFKKKNKMNFSLPIYDLRVYFYNKNKVEVLFDKIKLRQEFLLKIYEFIQKF